MDILDLNGVWVGLFKRSPWELKEISTNDTNYKRIEMTNIDWNCIDIENKKFVINSSKIEFPQSISNWGRITHFGIIDNENNILLMGNLLIPKFIEKNEIVAIEIGNLFIDLELLEINK